MGCYEGEVLEGKQSTAETVANIMTGHPKLFPTQSLADEFEKDIMAYNGQ
jgi:hypothetical protein